MRLKTGNLVGQRLHHSRRDVGRIADQQVERPFHALGAIRLPDLHEVVEAKRRHIPLCAGNGIIGNVRGKHFHARFLGKRACDAPGARADLERPYRLLRALEVIEHSLDEQFGLGTRNQHA